MCISNGATYSGTISSISATSKICITGNGKFTGNINNIPAGTQIYIESGSQFIPNGLGNIGGTITNHGTVTLGSWLNFNAAFTVENSGTFNFNSGMSVSKVFNITNSGTLNFNGGFQSSSSVVTINNSGTFLTAAYTTMPTGSSITNSGTFTASEQQSYTGITINNTGGQFYFTASYNVISGSSSITNNAFMSLNGFTLNNAPFVNNNDGTVIFQSTFTLANSCSFTNHGTANFQSNFQLNNGSTMINNGNIQMNNGNTYLNTNGTFTNNGYIYVNGKITFGGSSTPVNNCTIVAVNGFTNQSANTQNYGYILIPLDSDPSNSVVVLEQNFYNGENAWVQGINFTHSGGTVTGSGNYYFTGHTINYNQFGNNSTPPANFYDATPTPSSPSSGMFDDGYGATSNTTKNSITPLDINDRPASCNSNVISQGINTECFNGYNTVITNSLVNGSFTSTISNSTGNTYTNGAGTTYNFSGGSFIAQTDYRGTSATACARTNMAQGNAFAIVTLSGDTYTGSGNCSAANQKKFPGDGAYNLPAQSNFMYVAGNTLTGTEYLVYQQNISGLVIGNSYTFYFYVSNLREPANNAADPIIRIRMGGLDGFPDGTICYGPYLLTETETQNSAALNGWKRIAYNFTATATTAKLKITDAAFTTSGDEWGLTSIGLAECQINEIDSDGDGVNDRDDVDDDNDGILDIDEYGCTATSQFTWSTSGTPNAQTVAGVTLTPYLRNPFGLSNTTITMTNQHTGNASNDIKFVCNPTVTTQYADLVLSFNHKITNLSFEINDIDARNSGANIWKDSIYVLIYKDGTAYSLRSAEFTLGSQVSNFGINGFVTSQTNNNLGLSSNNGRVIISINEPIDSVAIRFFDAAPNNKNADIYISAVTFCKLADTDGDGIPDYLDVDSDNDGIPDVIENYGIDANGDGRIDCTFNATTGLADCLPPTGLVIQDFDGDGVPNYLDLDSDNDGIPDIIEVQGTDSNNDGKVDAFTDTNENGLHDAYENGGALLLSGSSHTNGLATTWPYKNIDLLGYPNPYDLDSDGDGLTDIVESGLIGQTGSNGTVETSGGIVTGTRTNGWANTVRGLASLNLLNTDSRGLPDYLDIDSDDDGVTDNIEAQSTYSYKVPNDTDTDNDGITDVYEMPAQVGVYGGNGLTPFDFDGDGTPDYRDTDTDNDGVPDYIEATGTAMYNINYNTLNFTDTDGDGLIDQFDNINITTLTAGNLYKNGTMGNMGPDGNFDGPIPTGSLPHLPKNIWNTSNDRDWRNALILPLNIVEFTAILQQNKTVQLKWHTLQEINTNHYIVEYSYDSKTFNFLYKINAYNIGAAIYTYVHDNIGENPIIYYRIKQVDKDGRIFYTEIKSVKIQANTHITVHNNPFSNQIRFTYTAVKNNTLKVNLIASDGRVVYSSTMYAQIGKNTFLINNLDKMPQGSYFLHISSENIVNSVQLFKR